MVETQPQMAEYLGPTSTIDSDHPAVIDFAAQHAGALESDIDVAVALYYAIRDGFRYDPYRVDLSVEGMRASGLLARDYGFCITKAILMAAAARAEGIPSRLGFGDVVNHLATDKLKQMMQTDLFVFHGYVELRLNGRWVKATPAFNATMCERFDVEPLRFDGVNDAMFQQFDRKGNRYMEYVADRGHYADLPLDEIIAAFDQHYPSSASWTPGP